MRVCSHCRLVLPQADASCPHDGAPTVTAEPLEVPETLGTKWLDFQPFAIGQSSVTFLATQPSTGYRGLLKVMPLGTLDSSERVRIKRELRKQARLSHESLPRIIDGGETASELWLFREFVAGESLGQRIRRLGTLDPPLALAITAQAAACLDELQRNGLLHRDVKPAHIVLSTGAAVDGARGEPIPLVRLTDAGIASRLSTGSIFDLLGTPAYISPEQVMGKLVSFRSDLYSLGCVLFEMLSGKPPFPGDDVRSVLEAHKSAAAPPLSVELPDGIHALLQSMLAKEPRQRPFSAQQVRRTLEPILPEGTPLPAPGTRAPTGTPIPKSPLPVALPPLPNADVVALDTGEIDLGELQSLPPSSTVQLADEELEALRVRVSFAGESAVSAAPAPPPAVTAGADGGPATMMLGERELHEMAVGHSAPPPAATMTLSDRDLRDMAAGVSMSAAPATMMLGDQELREMAVGQSAVTAAAKVAAVEPAVPQAARAAPDSAASTGATRASQPDSPRAAAAPRAPAPAAPAASIQDAAPTALYRAVDDENAPTREAHVVVPVVRPHRAQPATPAAPRASVLRRAPVLWAAIAAAVVAILVMVATFTGKREVITGSTAPWTPEKAPRAASHRARRIAAPETTANAARVATPETPPAGPSSSAPAPMARAANDDNPAVAYVPELPPDDEPRPVARAGRPATEPRDDSAGAAASIEQHVAKAAEYKMQGRAHYQAGRYREAAAAYHKATLQNANDAGAFAGLAASRLAAGDVNGAVVGYAKAVRLEPSSSGFRAALGRAYLQKGDRKRARTEYERALELDANNLAAKTALDQLK